MTRARDLADYISTGVSDTELDVLDGVTAGTVTASKALVVDANKDIASLRNITATGAITGTVSTAAQTNITSLGTLTALTVDDITIDGSTISDGGDFTLDVGGNIIIDSDGGNVLFKDGGTDYGQIASDSNTKFLFYSAISDGDMIFQGNDGGSTVTALTLDMSDGGSANFHRPRSNTAGDCAVIVDPSDTTVEYGFRIDTANNAFNIDRVDNTTNLLSISATGDVGIGTSSPTGTLSVSDATYLSNSSTLGSSITLNSENTASWSGSRELISFESVGNGADHRTGTLSLKLKKGASDSTLTEYMQINAVSNYTTFSTDGSERMRIDANGDANFTEELKAKSYNETYVSLSAASSVAIDCETGNVFALTTGQNTTFTFSNPPASGTAYGFTLKLTAGGGHTITYPNSVDFAGGTAPDAPASGETDVLVFITVDGGTNWYGALAIDAAG
jgi:hypothetical protein